MKQGLTALIAGTIFGLGLAVSGMMDPARVRGFLDVFGQWDPTLVFVMGGASVTMMIVWRFQRGLSSPLIAPSFHLPGTKDIDGRLITGATLFGIGWGIAGLCPGPGIASLLVNPIPAATFVGAMLIGMAIFRITEKPDA